MREIVFFKTDFGEKPVEQFLDSLDSAPRAKVVWTLELLRTQQMVSSKFRKKLAGSDLWEVRTEYAGNIYRLVAAFAKNNRVILNAQNEQSTFHAIDERFFQKTGESRARASALFHVLQFLSDSSDIARYSCHGSRGFRACLED